MKRKKNALLVFVKEEIQKRTFLLLRAENAPSLSLSLSLREQQQRTPKTFLESDEKGFALRVYKYVSRAIAPFFNFLLDLNSWRDFYLLRVWETLLFKV